MDKLKTESSNENESGEDMDQQKDKNKHNGAEQGKGSFVERRKHDRRKDNQKLNEQLDSMMGTVSEKNSEVEKLQKELESMKETMVRRQADFENYKKRSLKQFQDQKKFAIKDFALDIIMAQDELLRAIDAASSIDNDGTNNDSHSSFIEGVSMISKMIHDALGKHGVVEIEATNVPFDPNVHEAVEIDESDKVDVDTVTKVYQKGFCIEDIIIRSSKVCVSKPGKKNNSTDESALQEDNAKDVTSDDNNG